MLLGIISFACTDEEDTEQLEKGDDTTDVHGGRFITTTITVSTAAPDLSVDLEGTRAGNDKANIEHDQTENGGRFQNVVVVVTNDKDSVYAIHCNKWYGDRPTSTGVKKYEVIFPDVQIYTTNGKKAKVYAFGNVDMDRWNTINGYTVEAARKLISEYAEINNLMKAQLKVDKKDIYNIRFVPESGNYKVDDDEVTNTCTGMPVNGTANAEVKKGSTKFSVHMRRVCARLQVTFRNFTGTYKVYGSNNIDSSNNVYVDKFVIKKVLATTTNYFHDCVDKGDDYTPSETGDVDFNILNALGGSMTNDHKINKIENGKDLTVSMYVFENKKKSAEAYTYDLKVDRGKNLGLNTTVIDPENAYVIWNNSPNVTNPSSISYRNGKIQVSQKQTSYELIPFSDQVFWQFVEAPKPHVDNVFALKHYQIDVNTDKHIESDIYLTQVTDKEIDWGTLGLFYSYKHINSSPATQLSKAQYIQFKQKTATANEFTMNLLNESKVNRDYWDSVWLLFTTTYRHLMLTLCNDDHDSNNNNQLSTQRSDFWNGNMLGNYDWTLYAKYIIKKDKLFGEGKDEAVTQYKKITRNSSYSMDFSVMPNYEVKQELLVNCVRDQKTISWESVDK